MDTQDPNEPLPQEAIEQELRKAPRLLRRGRLPASSWAIEQALQSAAELTTPAPPSEPNSPPGDKS